MPRLCSRVFVKGDGWGELEKTKTETGAETGSAKDDSFWTPEREDALMKELPADPGAKDEAINKVRALHPKLKKLNTIQRRLQGTAPSGDVI